MEEEWGGYSRRTNMKGKRNWKEQGMNVEGGSRRRVRGKNRKVEDRRWKEREHYRRSKDEIKVGGRRNKNQWRRALSERGEAEE